MYRFLLMFPSSAPAAEVDRWRDEELLPAFSAVSGFVGASSSVGPLMGPSAKLGRLSVVLTVEFESLDAALEAVESDAFAKGLAESAAMGVEVYLFETASS